MDKIIVSAIVTKTFLFFCLFILFLTVCGIITGFIKKGNGATSFNNRMKTLWVLIALFAGSFSFSRIFAFVFLSIISVIGLSEYSKLIQKKDNMFLKNCWIYLCIPVQYVLLYKYPLWVFCIFIPLCMLVLIPLIKLALRNDKDIIKHSAFLYFGLVLIVYSLGYLGAFLLIESNGKTDGLAMIAFILIITLMNDFMQAVFGFLFGRHKITPVISPNKTVEGLLGGIFMTVLLSVWMGKYLTPLTLKQLVLLGVLLGGFGFLGDISMSAIKRKVGVKDTSNLLPGHGGFLDRFDSLFYTAPLFFYYLIIVSNINFIH